MDSNPAAGRQGVVARDEGEDARASCGMKILSARGKFFASGEKRHVSSGRWSQDCVDGFTLGMQSADEFGAHAQTNSRPPACGRERSRPTRVGADRVNLDRRHHGLDGGGIVGRAEGLCRSKRFAMVGAPRCTCGVTVNAAAQIMIHDN